ncbi:MULTISPECIES: hypothetical protein [unclassified Streptomyces]|uniref:hypothetical protein n=1 Tax=unclassified Streptomyces TaxID=2593676 RepID=UPI0004C6F6CB|nr:MULTISPECIES: hypothetical protein [unclassified Streptomyces]MBG7704448.1 hypothetical protein [Streptomyces sp. MC1]
MPVMEMQHLAIEQAHAEAVGLLPAWRSTGQGGQELADAFELLSGRARSSQVVSRTGDTDVW